nr:glycosyltransferase family 4 protein [Nakamurella panacisegetis]
MADPAVLNGRSDSVRGGEVARHVVDVIVPAGIDDPRRPSGGNRYDRRVCDGLRGRGWQVREHAVPGRWPQPEDDAFRALAEVMARFRDGAVLLIDGLIASAAPDVLLPHAIRLRPVVLVHMPAADRSAAAAEREHAVLQTAAAVITTSHWTRHDLLRRYGLGPALVHVAHPGTDQAVPASGSVRGGRLLCVGAVIPGKGHDVLFEALAGLGPRAWTCTCVGALDIEPGFVHRLRRQLRGAGLGGRVRFTGPLGEPELSAAYADADLLVLASAAETYGMVVAEALARGLPVVATAVGGLPESLGRAKDGTVPGILVPPADPRPLSAAIDHWLGDPGLRERLRHAAGQRRETLAAWSDTVAKISAVLIRAGA